MGKGEWTIMAVFTAIGVILAIIAITAESVIAKWIWGILAFAVLVFTLYATIEGIVKSKRKPKDMADLLLEYLKAESKKPDFAQKFADGVDEQSARRDLLYKAQQPYDDDYGYSCTNPIMTSSVWASDKYLGNLRTFDGEQFVWNRVGSQCVYQIGSVKNVMVDEYKIIANNWPDMVIYICPYGHNGSFAPKGLTLQEKIDKTAQAICRIYPSFDLEEEKHNPTFLQLIRLGIGMQEAYEVLNKEKLLSRKPANLTTEAETYISEDEAYQILCKRDEFLGTVCYEAVTEDDAKAFAEKLGVSFNTGKILLEEKRANEVKKATERKDYYRLQSNLVEEICREYPQFNLTKEMENQSFVNIVQAGIGLQLAFEVLHIDELFVRKAH
ncbi:MAG: hypothetical protein IJO72_02510 [Oscillospiraceae bacterium]|nr:hypothetical protein [Oscillospiraceae bacterium]